MGAEFILISKICKASANGRQDDLAEIINSTSFEGATRVVAMAINCFMLTDKNITQYSDAAVKLAKLKKPESFREGFRHALLVHKLKSLGFKID